MQIPITFLDEMCLEGNSFPIVAQFRDGTGELVVPNPATVTWRLQTTGGVILKAAQSIDSASEINIVLDGEDTLIGDYSNERQVVVKGQYNSLTYGNDRDILAIVQFYIYPIPGGP